MIKGFIKYLKGKGRVGGIAVVIAVGLLLIFIGSVGRDENEEELEQRLSALISDVEGVGECSVLVYRSADGDDIESVIVVCEGGDSPAVRLSLTEILSSFLGIGSNRVRVEKMSG